MWANSLRLVCSSSAGQDHVAGFNYRYKDSFFKADLKAV